MTGVRTGVLGVFILLLFFLFSCSSQPVETYKLEYHTSLLDGKKAKIVFNISYDNKSSVDELANNLKRVKYALNMVFSRMKSQEILAKNGESTKNSLFRILDQTFKIKPQKVEIIELKIY